ncbi:Flagellar assembly factor FliW [bioreactor metagenome]|uniref:Flagellar assembly factor FliW n=1 Tax=bioreactor metagenome TaxID=1076179 RepID=A0A645H8K3_9ZZZZ
MASRITETKHITSSYFGDIEISPNNIFYFENGMLGFDTLNNFVLISDDDIEPFKWLMALEEPEIMFPIISPWLVEPNYKPENLINIEKKVLFSVVTLDDGDGNITANMKAPIILDSVNLIGEQIILSSDKYSVNQIIQKHK